ncbi:class A sortase [Guggenheimella bovis]
MKKKILTVLGVLFLTAGIILLVLYFNIENVLTYTTRPEQLEKITATVMEENNKKEVVQDFKSIDNTAVVNTMVALPKLNMDYVIGQMYVPELNLNLPINKGVTEANLLTGAATMKLDQKMGEGNYTLAGHYMRKKDLIFHRIRTVPLGTHVYITDKKNIYHYIIVSRDVYPQDAFYMLEDDRCKEYGGKPILSLMTCNYNAEDGRIFAVGVLEDVTKYEEGVLKVFETKPEPKK